MVSWPPVSPLQVEVDLQAEPVTEVPLKSNVLVRTITLGVLSAKCDVNLNATVSDHSS